ncbi:hypothetical protein [Geoglobus ahangari]
MVGEAQKLGGLDVSTIFELSKIAEPLLKFKQNTSMFKTDIVKYGPYSSSEDINAQIKVVYPKNIKKEVERFISILKDGDGRWPFKNGINSTFKCFFEFNVEEVNESPTQEIIKDIIDASDEDILIIFGEDFEDIWELKAYAWIKSKRLQLVNIETFRNRFQASDWNGMYLLNFGVQLYSKANGTPWILERKVNMFEFVKENSLILGLSFGRFEEDIHYGVAQVVDLYGLTINFEIFDAGYLPEIDGYYIPQDEMRKLLKNIEKLYTQKWKAELDNIYFYKSTQFIDEEIKGVSESIGDESRYYLIHVKTSGLSIRGYDKENEAYTIRRGVVLLYPEKKWCALWTTGNLGTKRHVLGTPKSIEIQLLTNSKEGARDLIKHISFQTLALTKIDWEHANWNVRTPAVFKYSNRAIRIHNYLNSNSNAIRGLDVRDLM